MADRVAMPTDHDLDPAPAAPRAAADPATDTVPDAVLSDPEAPDPEVADAGAADAAVADAADGRRSAHVLVSVRSLRWQARIAAALAVVFAGLAVLFYLQASGLRADAAARTNVLDAGRAVALQITTYDGVMIDQWISDTQDLATSSFAEEVATLFDPELREGLAANQVRSDGEITSSFVQEIDGDSATVFAVLRQTYSSINLPREVSDQLRMEVELARVDGRWLADNVVALGPSTISPVDSEGAAPLPAEGEGG